MDIKTITNPDQTELFHSLAAELLRFFADSSSETLTVALPGGRSVVGLLRPLLVGLDSLPQEVRASLQFFMLDERCVSLSSEDSNFKLLNEQVFMPALKQGLLTPYQLHPFDIESGGTPEMVADEYFRSLSSFGGRFSVAVLGVGEDSHVGALFPNHHSVRDDKSGFIIMPDSPKPPPMRMSVSRSLLEQTEFGVALFIGEAKREAYGKFLEDLPVEQCPVSILRTFNRSLVGTDIS